MAKKKQEEAPAGSPAWMATFSDLMNLLLCFFVLLFSMSSVDAAKYEMVVNSLTSAFSILPAGGSSLSEDGMLIAAGIAQLPGMSNYFGDTLSKGEGKSDAEPSEVSSESEQSANAENSGEAQQGEQSESQETQEAAQSSDSEAKQENEKAAEAENMAGATEQGEETAAVSEEEAMAAVEEKGLSQSEEMAQEIEELSQQYGIQDLVEVDFNGQYVRITLNGALLFESGSSDLSEEAKPLVEKMGKIIDLYRKNIVEVEGHTDNVPIHSSRFESNDVLSMYRALSVADFLRGHSDIPQENIVSSGRGAYKPVADNSTPEGRARNRRVEIKIYNELNSEEAVEE